VRPRRHRQAGAHPLAARHGGRAPSPHPRGQPREGGARDRIGRRPRGGSRRPAPRGGGGGGRGGAGRLNPSLAFETLDAMIRQGLLPGLDQSTAVTHYIKALNKGVLKVISKMGISTIQSYRGAQIFEAIGLDRAFVDRYFTWTASRIGGVGIDVIAEEAAARHARAFPDRPVGSAELEWGGEYQWRREGEYHLFNPDTVFKLQHATRSGQFKIFKDYTRAVDDQSSQLATLRGLFVFRPADQPVPLDAVEPVEAILRRFATGAMS